MTINEPYFFVSYSHRDADIVHEIVAGLQARGVKVWMDIDLMPGENWQRSITQALSGATGLIVFVSAAGMAPDWVGRELTAVAASEESFIIPVILERVPNLPHAISSRQWIDVSGYPGLRQVEEAVEQLARTIAWYVAERKAQAIPALREADLMEIAASSVEQARGEKAPPAEAMALPDSVFIVHGHDLALRDQVEAYLASLGVKPIVLSKMANAQQSLLQKFLTWSRDVRFAVVLISADDRGASRRQFDTEGVGERALQFRARQNVILELGFFYGYLGWEHVFVLYKPPDEVYPNFERPSDLDGIPFDEVDREGRWQTILAGRLRQAGFAIP